MTICHSSKNICLINNFTLSTAAEDVQMETYVHVYKYKYIHTATEIEW